MFHLANKSKLFIIELQNATIEILCPLNVDSLARKENTQNLRYIFLPEVRPVLALLGNNCKL